MSEAAYRKDVLYPECDSGRGERASFPWQHLEPRGPAPRESNRAPARAAAGERWLQDAREQLANLDADAREDRLDPPPAEAREFAEKFILEFAKAGLLLASVFADEDRGVSIQMEASGFFFLLTCFKGGSGLYNVAQETYRFAGSYKSLSIADIPESEFMRRLQCMMKPLTKDARSANRRE